jgi:hypothetical protein
MRRIKVRCQSGQIVQETLSKITRAKWIGVITQVVDHLLCKHKTMNSNPSLTKKKKRNGSMSVIPTTGSRGRRISEAGSWTSNPV